jgi:subtilisin family serine protease
LATEKKKPATPRKRAPAPREYRDESPVSERLARTTAPRQLEDPERRRKWDLPSPDEPEKTGSYIVELNVQHVGGLPGAANAFLSLYDEVVLKARPAAAANAVPADDGSHEPLRIAKSYYKCMLRDREWRALVRTDEAKPARDRAFYRLWPDFPVTALTDRSVTTIKADAALRSFNAAGEKIVWAVVDSGIDASHLHFGATDAPEQHTLTSADVADLHRCFADIYVEKAGGLLVAQRPLKDPDAEASMEPEARAKILDEHRRWALRDDYGHGTHVAGIIAGQDPGSATKVKVCALEREFRIGEDGQAARKSYQLRIFDDRGPRPTGVAPQCKLISLRVLDHKGKGRASQVIQALEYIRDGINDNPKLMRVHGVNLSVGYEFDAEMFACGQSPLCTAVDRLVQEGVVVVTAAGNTGYGTNAADVGASKMGLSNSINDPGNAAGAITVGSTHRDSPHTYGVSYFSSKGPTGDGRLKPDLVAPGERITSCAAGQKLRDASEGSGIDAQGQAISLYVDDSGTSMAAPHVSGAIAAFLSIRREFIGKPLEVKRIFLDSATPLGRERYFEGHGLLDLMRAIQQV